ncbi:MAG: SDR family NAD(P)-dependent oxidoreductase [Hymenobacteraceae bacterium]|nr:SDR family NAD(P)-dependent oxidoreductase [Hymenobacteraceae bacterium]
MADLASSGAGQTALITGASSGIGFELTRLFARDGYRLVLVALPTDQIQEAEDHLRTEFPQTQIDFFAVDLSYRAGADYLVQLLRGRQIDVLVNDAGFGDHGKFAETSLEKELAMVNLNISALLTLTKMVLPPMIQRGAGRILQLGSIAAFSPNPLLAVYGATKAFVRMFTEAVQNEIEGTGVTMTLLCPPATETNFFAVANMEHTREVQEGRAKGGLRAAADVARDGYEALMAGTARVMSGPEAKMQPFLASIMSDAMLAKQTRSKLEDIPAGQEPKGQKSDNPSKTGGGAKKAAALKSVASKVVAPKAPAKPDAALAADKTAVAKPAMPRQK